MAEINKSFKPRAVLPAVALVASLYYSFTFTAAMLIGYLGTRVFCKMFLHKGRVDSIYVTFGKYKLHLHHWIMGLFLLAMVWVIDYFYLPTFFAGIVIGVIIQDIYDYNDWYKVIMKNPIKKKAV